MGLSADPFVGGAEHGWLERFPESLPLDEFPNLVELAEPMTAIASEEQFEWGLRAMLAGFARMTGEPPAGDQPALE